MAIDAHYDFDSEIGATPPKNGNSTPSDAKDTLIVASKLWSLFNKKLFTTPSH